MSKLLHPPKQKTNAQLHGQIGEQAAVSYLSKQGYKIIEQNVKVGYGELDIIATHQDTTVFIEVKTRYTHEFGTPEEAITPWKMRTLLRSIAWYMLAHEYLPELLRLDLVVVEVDEFESIDRIEHIENISPQ